MEKKIKLDYVDNKCVACFVKVWRNDFILKWLVVQYAKKAEISDLGQFHRA